MTAGCIIRRLGTTLALLLVSATAGAQGVAVDAATDEQKSEASEAFREARAAYDDRRFADALRSFEASYEVVASPNAHLMIGYSLRELGRLADAYEQLGRVARDAEAAAAKNPKYEETAQLAREAREELRSQIALVTVQVPPSASDATLSVGGRDIPPERWSEPIAAQPGRVVVVLRAQGESRAEEVQAAAGGTATVDLTEPPEEEEEGGAFAIQWTGTQQYIAYGVAGLGVVSLAAAAGLGGAAQSTHGELRDACGAAPCPPDRQGDIDRGRALRDASNATLIIGLAAVGAGAALFFTAPHDSGDEADSATAPWLEVGPTSLTLRGRF